MATTHFSGPVYAGTQKDETGVSTDPKNIGPVLLSQSVALVQDSTNVVSEVINIPVGSHIVDILFDVLTAFDSANTAVGSVGLSAGATQFAGAVDLKTTGRKRPAFTAAQLAAMTLQSVLGVPVNANVIRSSSSLVVSATPDGATGAGYVYVTVLYLQLPYGEE